MGFLQSLLITKNKFNKLFQCWHNKTDSGFEILPGLLIAFPAFKSIKALNLNTEPLLKS